MCFFLTFYLFHTSVDSPNSQKDFSNDEYQDNLANKKPQDNLGSTKVSDLDFTSLSESLNKALHLEMQKLAKVEENYNEDDSDSTNATNLDTRC